MNNTNLEQRFFRALNKRVEPLLLNGSAASGTSPVSLVLLETTGYKSGQQRRTPVWSLRLGSTRLIGTARGDQSFWIKNLYAIPGVSYMIGGTRQEAEAIVVAPDFDNLNDWNLGALFGPLANILKRFVGRGWAFAMLVPRQGM